MLELQARLSRGMGGPSQYNRCIDTAWIDEWEIIAEERWSVWVRSTETVTDLPASILRPLQSLLPNILRNWPEFEKTPIKNVMHILPHVRQILLVFHLIPLYPSYLKNLGAVFQFLKPMNVDLGLIWLPRIEEDECFIIRAYRPDVISGLELLVQLLTRCTHFRVSSFPSDQRIIEHNESVEDIPCIKTASSRIAWFSACAILSSHPLCSLKKKGHCMPGTTELQAWHFILSLVVDMGETSNFWIPCVRSGLGSVRLIAFSSNV